MARRFRNTSAEYLLTPDITAQSGATRWTVAGWMYHEIQSYTSGGFIYQQASGSTMQFFWDTTGKYYRTRWDTSSGANLVDIGETHLRAQRWYFYTCQYDGAEMRVFLDKTLIGTAAPTGGLSNNDGFYFARNTPGSVPFNGSLAHWGMWNRVLSPADIYQLADGRPMLELAPNQLYLPMWGTTPELDLSPNSYSITLGGHPPAFADPPQLSTWRVEEPWMVVVGTIYDQAVAGTLTSAGAIARTATKLLAGTLTSAGALATLLTYLQAVAGTLTSAGTLTKQTATTLAGSAASSGVLARSTAKAMTGAIASVGTIAKQTATTLVGTLTSSGALATTTVVLQAVAGALSSAGALAKTPAKAVAGALTSAGALTRQTAVSLVGTVTSAGALASVRTFFQAVAGVLSSAGALATSLVAASSDVAIDLTARVRSTALTLRVRSTVLTLRARLAALTLFDRD